MKTLCRILLLVALATGGASAQTIIQVTPAVPVVAGQSACLGSYQGQNSNLPGNVPCDNTAQTPAPAGRSLDVGGSSADSRCSRQ